jgi:integrase
MAAYQAALDCGPAPQAKTKEPPGSFGALCAAYYASAAFLTLQPVTRATYRNVIEALRAQHGDKPVAMLQREHVRRLLLEKVATPNAANARLKVLRLLMALAIDLKWRRDDPTHGLKRLRIEGDGFATWSEGDIVRFEARWPLGTMQRLAFALMLYTGQRGRSDAAKMGPQHMQAGRIAVRQQKTGTRLSIPVHPELRAAIEACPSGQLAFVTSATGAPFTSGSFGNWFADACRAAGLKGLAAHGLRKAAARRLAEAGCTAHEIAAVTGHRSLRDIETYTRAADQVMRSDAAMAKVSVKLRAKV